MKNKKILILTSIIIIIIIFLTIFFIKNNYKIQKHGNNIINKSADEIKEYILNMESYKATTQITIKSNKNENNYIVIQKYNKENNIYKQEVLQPETIRGVQFIYDGKTLKIENTKINVNKIYEDYKYIENSNLSLISFIEDFKKSEKNKCNEENGIIILETEVKEANKYTLSKKLYINKKEGKVEKMEIKDMSQNVRIYILYNEIEINTISKEEILAFSVKTFEENI